MRGQDQGTVGCNAQAIEHGHAARHQHVCFAQQRLKREHDAIADEAGDLRSQDAGWNQREDRLFPADDQRMTGVVPALKTRYGTRLLSEQVDDFALAFVTPLGTDDDNETTFGHRALPPRQRVLPPGLRMYLKKSLSGDTTITSPSLPSEFLYAWILR